MNTSKQLIAFIISILISTVSVAHSSHGPKEPISQAQAEVKAELVIKRLVKKYKLDRSWKEAQLVAASQQEKAQGQVWIIQYTTSSASDADKKSLYVVLDEMGNTLSATHSEP
ncbi:MAG: DUF6488 family protein [Neptuniibacter sp.]